MAYPTYFSQFPNSKYAISVNKSGQTNNISIKDFYHLMRLRNDVYTESNMFVQYIVENGERPENISYKIYGDEQYYWVILQVNDVVDYYNQWPLSIYEFEKFILKKYGSWENASKPHHWETTEAVTEDGIIMLPAGLNVSENFTYTYVYSADDSRYIERTVVSTSVSNVEYENKLNDAKKVKFILNKKYLGDYIRETYLYASTRKPQESQIDPSTFFR